MPTAAPILARMLAFDGLTATFGSAVGPCQRDVGLTADDFAGRSMEPHAEVLTGITSVLVQASLFSGVRIGDSGYIAATGSEAATGKLYRVRDRETKNDGDLLRLFLEKVPLVVTADDGTPQDIIAPLPGAFEFITALVSDAQGTPQAGVLVTFTGTGLTFDPETVLTDVDGLASTAPTAELAGEYTALATVFNGVSAAEFDLTLTELVEGGGRGGGGGA